MWTYTAVDNHDLHGPDTGQLDRARTTPAFNVQGIQDVTHSDDIDGGPGSGKITLQGIVDVTTTTMST